MSTIRVDRITPYQSGSVAIESLSISNLTIEGTLTASIQEGYVLVGGSGNVSTLAATSSFGGGDSTDITALNSYTESADGRFSNLESATSSLQSEVDAIKSFTASADDRLVNLESTTSSLEGQVSSLNLFTASQDGLNGSFATTGSNVFIGTQTISGSILVSGSINSDGYELEASSTSTIPALNSTFNLDLSGSSIYSTNSFINKSLLLGDGKVLIAGKFQSIDGHTTNDIARLNSNGTIDTSFTAPLFAGQFGEFDYFINTFVTQSDSKIIVGGTFSQVSGSNRRGLARLNTNGTLDESFATQSWGSFGEVRDIAIQNDDKIVVVGYFTSGSRRFNTDGTPDTSFDMNQGNNQPSAFNNGYYYSVGLLDSGSEQAILIGGSFNQWGSFADYHHLVKLNPSGTLDFGFAGTNLDIATGNELDRIKKIKVGDDGYIYVAGRFKDTLSGPNVRNAGFGRVTTTDEGDGIGAFDSGFRTYISGSDQNLSGVSVYVNDFDFYDSDKILLGGNFITFGIPGYSTTSANRFAIIRQSTGGLISNWSTDGLASKYNLNTGSVNSVTLLPNDNVLVGGTFTSASSPQTAREGLASLKLTGFGEVTTTIDYSITADTTQLLISSSNTRFSGDITASVISGSFVGDGSGLTNLTLPSGVVSGSTQVLGGSGILSSSDTNFTDFSQSVDTRIDNIVSGTGFATTSSFNELTQSFNSFTSSQEDLNVTFATTGSNTFVGNQGITGSIVVSGSISQKGVGGTGNIVIGENPLTNLTSEAIYNVIIGQDAGVLNSSGSSNVYIGRNAGILNQIGNSNVMIGTYAGYNAKNSQNVYIGESAGAQNISGQYNVAIGHQAGYNNKVNSNTFIGFQSGFQNTSGSANTFVGERSGESNTIGGNNSFFGGASGRDNSVGSNNTFIGQNAGQQNTSGSYSTFVGSQAGTYTTTGNNNTFVGAQAGILNTLGYSNAFFGDNSGYNNTTAYENTFVGSFSGYENRTGAENTFVGTSAGQNNGVGNDNTFVGHRAGNSNISGSNNTLVGKSAGFANTIGNRNTLLGTEAGEVATSGDDNLMLGYKAGAITNNVQNLTNSNTSIFLGSNARGVNNASNQIVIGALAEGNGSNTTTIGNDSTTATYLKGTLNVSTAILAQVSSSYDFADDTAAQAGGVPLGGLYHTSGTVKIRLV